MSPEHIRSKLPEWNILTSRPRSISRFDSMSDSPLRWSRIVANLYMCPYRRCRPSVLHISASSLHTAPGLYIPSACTICTFVWLYYCEQECVNARAVLWSDIFIHCILLIFRMAELREFGFLFTTPTFLWDLKSHVVRVIFILNGLRLCE
jgi:hypothetical protein